MDFSEKTPFPKTPFSEPELFSMRMSEHKRQAQGNVDEVSNRAPQTYSVSLKLSEMEGGKPPFQDQHCNPIRQSQGC